VCECGRVRRFASTRAAAARTSCSGRCREFCTASINVSLWRNNFLVTRVELLTTRTFSAGWGTQVSYTIKTMGGGGGGIYARPRAATAKRRQQQPEQRRGASRLGPLSTLRLSSATECRARRTTTTDDSHATQPAILSLHILLCAVRTGCLVAARAPVTGSAQVLAPSLTCGMRVSRRTLSLLCALLCARRGASKADAALSSLCACPRARGRRLQPLLLCKGNASLTSTRR
jgi:hypothetical protein